MSPTLLEALGALRGRKVTTAFVVEDYFQVFFDGARMSVLVPARLTDREMSAVSDDRGFQAALEKLVGQQVYAVSNQGKTIKIAFSPDGVVLEVGLEEASAVEQFVFEDDQCGKCWVA